MSRNEERMSAPNVDKEAGSGMVPPRAVSANAVPQSSMTSYMPPTEIVDLPSKGRFYYEGHPLHMVESVEIKYMTAREEEILTNKQLIKKGLALDRLISSVLVDKSIDVQTLLDGDKTALLVATRITGFGEEYGLKSTCRNCSHINETSYDLSECTPNKLLETYNGAVRIPDGTGDFTMILPKTGAEIQCKLLRGIDQSNLFQIGEMRKKNKLMETPITDLFKKVIVAVNGNTDKGYINDFSTNMPTLDTRELRRIYAKMNPSAEMKFEVQCEKCDYNNKLDVPLTADFFWPSTE